MNSIKVPGAPGSISVLSVAACLVLGAARASSMFFDIDAQPLAAALRRFADQAAIQLYYPQALVEPLHAPALRGEFAVAEGLELLLAESGLEAVFVDGESVVIRRSPLPSQSPPIRPDENGSSRLDAPESVERPMEEVLVTSRKKEEALQDVPLSVVALDDARLRSLGVREVGDLHAVVPNAQFRAGSTRGEHQSEFTIRGVPGVAVYVDGIWQAAGTHLVNRPMVEIERVEVLRGPQGTLFGRQTSGGAVQIITRPPSEAFGARVGLTLGSFDQHDINVTADLPLTEKVLTKWTAARMQRDGFLKSVTVDASFGDIDHTVLRGDVLWKPSPDFQTRFIVDHAEFDQTGVARVTLEVLPPELLTAPPLSYAGTYAVAGFDISNELLASGWPGGALGKWETHATSAGFWTDDMTQYSIDTKWDVTDALTVRWLAAYRTQLAHLLLDNDLTPWAIRETLWSDRFGQRTHELQLLGEHGRIGWVAGLYYWDELDSTASIVRRQAELTGEDEARIRAIQPNYRFMRAESDRSASGTKGRAVFGEVSIGFGDRLDLALGVRYNRETVINDAYRSDVPPPAIDQPIRPVAGDPFAGELLQHHSAEFTSTTPRISARYRWHGDLMTYVSYSEGFGAGGLNVVTPPVFPEVAVIPFEAETVRNFEAGLRSDLAGGDVRLNATTFTMVWDDIQLSTPLRDPISGSFTTSTFESNAGKARIHGLELEGKFAVGESLVLHSSVGWLDARYTSVGLSDQITTHSKLQHAPKWSFEVGAEHRRALSNGGTLIGEIAYGWIDDQRLVQDDLRNVNQERYGLLSAGLVYRPAGESWQASLYGTNLTNEWYLTGAFNSRVTGRAEGSLGRPRQISAEIRFMFR